MKHHLAPKAEIPCTPEVFDAIDRINRQAIANIESRRLELIDLVYSVNKRKSK